MTVYRNIKGEQTMEKYILLLFIDDLLGKDINLVRLDEQLQISIQILINKGFKILVSGDGNKSFKFAKRFAYIFQDENVISTEDKLNNLQKDNLIKMSGCVICFEEEVEFLAKSLNSSCVFIDTEDNNENKEDEIKIKFNKFTISSLNAGELVKKIEESINYKSDRKDENSTNLDKNLSDEFEEYKKQIKKKVEQFINNNKLEDAKNLIIEYENIVKNDANICSMKGIIAVMEGRIEEGEEILKEGLLIYPISFDLLYNLGYIYEIQEKYTKEYLYYNKAILVSNEDTKRQLENKISQLDNIEEVKNYKVKEKNNIATEVLLIKMRKQTYELELNIKNR